MEAWLNHALQRTRHERRGCNPCVPWAGSLINDRLPASDSPPSLTEWLQLSARNSIRLP